MKSKIQFWGCACVLFLSAFEIYSFSQKKEVLDDLTLENVEAAATNESGMHGRPLLYNPDFGYKCGNCSGNDCGAVC